MSAYPNNTVKINREYVSARSGELAPATSPESWQALSDRIEALRSAGHVTVQPFADRTGSGLMVSALAQRVQHDVYYLHDLACRFGAIAAIVGPSIPHN